MCSRICGWKTRGTPDADFYKALIQLAGGFVHLIMHENPKWPAAGHRLRPAHRLLGKASGLFGGLSHCSSRP